jgi:homocysteine S-methyltransferase
MAKGQGHNVHRIVVLDGGLSTQLEIRGAEFSGQLWTGRALLEHPEMVREAHHDFVDAGAEIISTASYQVSRAGFLEVGLTAEDADRALVRSVELAREATKGTHVRVAASVGPYGAILHDGSEYRGNYGLSQQALEDFHRERIEILASSHPDFFAVETIPEITEAKAVAAVLADYPDIPAWVSFSCADDRHISSGETIEDAVAAIADLPSLIAVGVNCLPPEFIAPLATRIAAVSDIPIIGYPNRGGVWDAATETWSGHTPKTLAQWLGTWRDAGVTYVGGCCGHGATAIAQLKETLASA